MLINTKEDAIIFSKMAADIVLKIPKKYRKITIIFYILLNLFCIYYLHQILHNYKN